MGHAHTLRRWALHFAVERSNLGFGTAGHDPITVSQRPSAIVQKAQEPYHQGLGWDAAGGLSAVCGRAF